MRTRRWVSVLALALVVVSATWAAGGGEPAAKTGAAPIKYTWFLPEMDIAQVSTEWPVYKEMVKRMGVDIQFVSVPGANATEKRQVLIATNEVTDIMYLPCADAVRFGPDGVFMPLNDLIDKHGSNIKKVWDEWKIGDISRTQGSAAVDGKMYAVPEVELEKGQFRRNWFVRRDLMKQFGWQNPKTETDFTSLLRAFKAKFPQSMPLTSIGSADFFLGMFIAFVGMETTNGIGFDWASETYKFVPDSPGFKEMIVYSNKLLTEGLLDLEWATLNTNQTVERLATNKAFAAYSWRTRGEQVLAKVRTVEPNTKLDFFAIPPWAAPTGRAVTPGREYVQTRGYALSAKIKQPERAMRILDYMWSPEGQVLTNYGVEGVSFKRDGGKIIPLAGFNTATNEPIRRIGAAYDGFRMCVLPEIVSLVSGYPPEIQERDAIIRPSLMPAYKVLPDSKKITDLEKESGASIGSYFSQQVAKMIMGQTPITDANIAAGKKELERLGARKLVDAYNEAYAAAYKK